MFTALLIAILVVAGAATVVGGGLILSSRRQRALAGSDHKLLTDGGSGDPQLERTLRDLRVGDIVQHSGIDFLVEGVIAYDEDGHRWVSGRLVDGDDVRWLIVGMERVGEGGMKLVVEDSSIQMSGYPPESLTSGGTRFSLEKRGTATAKLDGDAGGLGGADKLAPESVLRCRWWRYGSAGDSCLIVEQWGGDYRALTGSRISNSDLEMMPGS
jgi:hypothetical protein